jgi:hypothetical protein
VPVWKEVNGRAVLDGWMEGGKEGKRHRNGYRYSTVAVVVGWKVR